jgi:type II secretory pathway component PulK
MARPRELLCRLGRQHGQASVELVAVLPLVLVVALVAWQLALTGHTLWLCAHAARVAARAAAVERDAEAAARSALPRSLERGLRVERRKAGGVRVELPVPVLVRRWRAPVSVGASASFGGPR